MRLLCLCCCVKAEGQGNSVEGSIVKCGYCVCAAMCRLKMKATVLKDPTATDTLANLIPASKAEEALVKKAGSKVNLNAAVPLHIMPCPALPMEPLDNARLLSAMIIFELQVGSVTAYTCLPGCISSCSSC